MTNDILIHITQARKTVKKGTTLGQTQIKPEVGCTQLLRTTKEALLSAGYRSIV
jgi:hypothetical protein